MKFFTPDLLDRFGSENDHVASVAEEELEKRSEAYVKHLGEIEGRLPQRFRELIDNFYMHDARVITQRSLMLTDLEWLEHELRMGKPPISQVFGESETCIHSYWIPLQMDPPPREVLVLQYRSVRIEDAKLHECLFDECPNLEWLHDEVELIESGGNTDFRHSILFTRGFEVQLRFKDFDFAILKPMEIAQECAAAIR